MDVLTDVLRVSCLGSSILNRSELTAPWGLDVGPEVKAAHVEKALYFYESAFGLRRRFVHESGQYAELETGATALAFADEKITPTSKVFELNRPRSKPAGAEVAFVVDDVETAYAQALAAGATSVVEPMDKPWGQTISYVRDLNGFLVEICSEVRG